MKDMNAKAKAQDLVDKFEEKLPHYGQSEMETIQTALELAKCFVDEILDNVFSIHHNDLIRVNERLYWQEVDNELNKL